MSATAASYVNNSAPAANKAIPPVIAFWVDKLKAELVAAPSGGVAGEEEYVDFGKRFLDVVVRLIEIVFIYLF
jgi:hypothetical protein